MLIQREAGLVRALGALGLAAGIVSMMIGAGILAALAGAPLNFRWLGLAMGLGMGTMLLLIALASPAGITGLPVLVLGSAGVDLLQSRIVARGAT